jgi:tetratricopeptide (TPR) repeat protein
LAYYRFSLGDLEGAYAAMEEGEALVGSDLELGRDMFGFSCAVYFAGSGAFLLAARGHCDEALARLERAFALARRSGIPENLGWMQGNAAAIAAYRGEAVLGSLGDARAGALEGVRIAEEMGSAISRVVSYSFLGRVHWGLGEWAEAASACETSLALARERRVGLEQERDTLATLALSVLGLGDAARARRLAEEALALGEERGQAQQTLACVGLAGALCAEQGRKARAAIEEALAAAEQAVARTGGRGLEPRIPEARAELARVCGDDASREHFLHEAQRLYASIGAAGHARRILGLLRGG